MHWAENDLPWSILIRNIKKWTYPEISRSSYNSPLFHNEFHEGRGGGGIHKEWKSKKGDKISKTLKNEIEIFSLRCSFAGDAMKPLYQYQIHMGSKGVDIINREYPPGVFFKGSQIFGQENKGSQIFTRKCKGSQINF